MMTLPTVETALQASNPYDEMDRLVRAELASGRKVKAVFETLFPMWDTVRTSDWWTEDAEEAFLGTLDALTGNCLREQCYEDPPDDSLPTGEEIARLPRWARVAFVARCARRVIDLTPDARSEIDPVGGFHTLPLSGVLKIAERAAATATFLDRPDVLFADDLLSAYRKAGTPLIRGIALAVAHATHVAYEPDGMIHPGAESVILAALQVSGYTPVERFIRRDFDYLLNVAEYRHWDDDTPVPPDVFGPLWPEGAPVGWPADPDVPPRDEFVPVVLVKDDVPHRHVVNELLNVFNAVNRYYIARNGQRLTLDRDLPLFLAALVPEGSAT